MILSLNKSYNIVNSIVNLFGVGISLKSKVMGRIQSCGEDNPPRIGIGWSFSCCGGNWQDDEDIIDKNQDKEEAGNDGQAQ